MKGFTFTLCVLLLTLVAGTSIAGKPQALKDLPITQEISDTDGNGVPYAIQSDGTGLYKDGTSGGFAGDVSILMTNVCGGLTWGDRLLDLQLRQVKITLTDANALHAGDFGYQAPARPFGTVSNAVRFMNKCTCGAGVSMYAMTAGAKIFCPMHLRLDPLDSTGSYYRIDMGTEGENETENVQITCNAADGSGCIDWFIDPISDPDYTENPGKTRARLNYFVSCHGKNCAPDPNYGDFYMTYHLHITRP
jgi:hypothetical protein